LNFELCHIIFRPEEVIFGDCLDGLLAREKKREKWIAKKKLGVGLHWGVGQWGELMGGCWEG